MFCFIKFFDITLKTKRKTIIKRLINFFIQSLVRGQTFTKDYLFTKSENIVPRYTIPSTLVGSLIIFFSGSKIKTKQNYCLTYFCHDDSSCGMKTCAHIAGIKNP